MSSTLVDYDTTGLAPWSVHNNHAFTGYTFALSYIKPIKKDFLVLSKKNDTFHIPRYEFDGKLFLSWSILFKRCEKIHLFVRFDSNNHQLSFGQQNKTATPCIDFSVNPAKIFEENGTFLTTPKGIQAQRQAFKMGILKMIRSHFSHVMCCDVHFENAFQLNCGDVVKVFYQNHWYKGYISSIKHTINSQTAKSQISFFINTPRILTSDIETFVEKCMNKIQHISAGLSMDDDVFKDITKLKDEDFIENITVHNPYEEQLQQLKQDALQTKQDLLKNLHQHPTVVDITFKNLNNKKTKEKNIYIMEDSYALA